jgi:hypothetical protein
MCKKTGNTTTNNNNNNGCGRSISISIITAVANGSVTSPHEHTDRW